MATRGTRRHAEFIRRRGLDASWQQAILLPRDAYDGTQDPGYSTQQDAGYFYADAIAYTGKKNRKFMFTSDDRTRAFDLNGALSAGRCTVTVNPNIDMGNMDRIILHDLVRTSSIEMVRSTSSSSDELPVRFVQEVTLLVDSAQNVYSQNNQFELITNNATGICQIKWLAGASAPSGKYYVNALAWPVWKVQGRPMRRNWGGGPDNQGPWRCNVTLDEERTRLY